MWKERIRLLLPYQVNAKLMKASGNAAGQFMHCLPAFHDTETTLGKQLAGGTASTTTSKSPTNVFESEWNIAFEQAENRLHHDQGDPRRDARRLKVLVVVALEATRCCVAASR